MIKTCLFFIFALCLHCRAQVKIGDNPNQIKISSVLEIESVKKGFLISRMTTEQRDLISIPMEGLLIYNTSTHCFNYYARNRWFSIGDLHLAQNRENNKDKKQIKNNVKDETHQ